MLNIACIITTSGLKQHLGLLKKCVHSVKKSGKNQVYINFFIVSDKRLRSDDRLFKSMNLIWVDGKSGFGSKNNLAIEKALNSNKYDYILFINDDAWISDNFFENFLEITKTSDLDAISPIIIIPQKNVIDSYGIEYFRSGYAKNSVSASVKTQLATAACLMVKTDCVRRVISHYGFFFNPIFDYYLEDVELSIRILSLGYKLNKSKRLKAFHLGSKTSGHKSFFSMYHTYRNIIWIIIINWPVFEILKNMRQIIMVQCWVIFYSFLRFGPILYLKCIYDTFVNLQNLINCRKQVTSNYPNDFKFKSVFSEYAFRTYHGYAIP